MLMHMPMRVIRSVITGRTQRFGHHVVHAKVRHTSYAGGSSSCRSQVRLATVEAHTCAHVSISMPSVWGAGDMQQFTSVHLYHHTLPQLVSSPPGMQR
jgi:hypothetical protein